jgi:hypothetical protein
MLSDVRQPLKAHPRTLFAAGPESASADTGENAHTPWHCGRNGAPRPPPPTQLLFKTRRVLIVWFTPWGLAATDGELPPPIRVHSASAETRFPPAKPGQARYGKPERTRDFQVLDRTFADRRSSGSVFVDDKAAFRR